MVPGQFLLAALRWTLISPVLPKQCTIDNVLLVCCYFELVSFAVGHIHSTPIGHRLFHLQ